jgi:tight adherence protein B
MDSVILRPVAFLAGALVIGGIYSLFCDLVLRDRSRVSRRVDEELRGRQRARVRKSALYKNPAVLAADRVPTLGWGERFAAMVEQSGLNLTPQRLLALSAATALGLPVLAMILRMALDVWDIGDNVLIAALMVPVGAALPFVYVHRKRKERLEKLVSQLPDTFELMSRVIRAGQTMAQAMQSVADEFEPPIAAEFSYTYEQQNLGLPPEIALGDLARRTGVLEVKIFVLALLVHQQAGGNLAELLDKLAGVTRERFRMRAKIKALTAEGRMQAAVLLILPPAMFVILLLLNPAYGQILLSRSLFLFHGDMLLALALFEVLGALWINKIVNFDF